MTSESRRDLGAAALVFLLGLAICLAAAVLPAQGMKP